MNIVFFILMFLCMFCILPFTIIFIVCAVKKQKKRLWGFLALGSVIGTILFAIIGGLLTPVCDHDFKLSDEKAATCTEDGYKLYICEKCGRDKTEKAEALGHDMVITSQKDATDNEDGEVIKKCSRCDYTETTVISKPTQALTESPTQAPKQEKTEKPTQAPKQEKTEKPKETPTKEPKKSEEEIEQEFKNSCETIDYETLARNPDKHKNENFKFEGKVWQVVESSWLNSSTTLLINVTETKYDYIDVSEWTDAIYCTVKIPDGEDRILEDDLITIWGTCKGMYTYTSVLGQSITVPRIDIEYFEIN